MPPCGTQDDENMMVLWQRSLYWSSSSVAPHRTPFTWGGGVCSFRARDFRSSGPSAESGGQGANPVRGNPTRVDESHDFPISFPTRRGVWQGVRKRDFLSDSQFSTYDVESRFRLPSP